jgi:ribosomal protein S27E
MASQRKVRQRVPPYIDPPGYVQEEFDAYLKSGRFEHGFVRVRCENCHAEELVAFSCKWRGFCPSCGARRCRRRGADREDPRGEKR